jgi:hypothetical protein
MTPKYCCGSHSSYLYRDHELDMKIACWAVALVVEKLQELWILRQQSKAHEEARLSFWDEVGIEC